MFARLKALLSGGGPPSKGGAPQESHNEDDLRLASAALLVEAACMDGQVDEAELETIASLLRSQFDLNEREAEELLESGREAASESSQLYAFTRIIKDRFSDDERVRMIEMLWQVAYADGHLHHYESNLVRRVAGLIYVPDRESGEARKRVLRRLGPPGNEAG